MIKYITAQNWETIDDEDFVVFLAGPIQGALGWHEEALKIFEEEFDRLKGYYSVSISKHCFGFTEKRKWNGKNLRRVSSTLRSTIQNVLKEILD